MLGSSPGSNPGVFQQAARVITRFVGFAMMVIPPLEMTPLKVALSARVIVRVPPPRSTAPEKVEPELPSPGTFAPPSRKSLPMMSLLENDRPLTTEPKVPPLMVKVPLPSPLLARAASTPWVRVIPPLKLLELLRRSVKPPVVLMVRAVRALADDPLLMAVLNSYSTSSTFQ